MAVYRVSFMGGELTAAAMADLMAAGAGWEGGEQGIGRDRHRALVEATTEEDAIAVVRRALASHGSFDAHDASPVRDAQGKARPGPVLRSWSDIDWQAVPRRASLTKLQRTVLGSMTNAGEPTWIIVADPGVRGDRIDVEAALEDLQQKGLVYSVLEQGGEPGRESEPDRWWAITDEGWDLLGMIKSPRYR